MLRTPRCRSPAPQANGHIQAAGSSGLLVHFALLTCSFDLQGNPDVVWTNGTTDQLTFTGTSTTGRRFAHRMTTH
jgi:hypothetical protein